ncbi:MAG: hypothetical protein AB8G22_01895 [Saprospiraceae bacterium]
MYRFLLFFLTLSHFVTAQTDTIPFVLTEYNNIYVEAIINGQDTAKLMFHTDADAVGVTEKAAEHFSSLKGWKESEAGSWGGGGTISKSQNNTVQIGNVTLTEQPIWKSRNSGHGTDGKFGFHFFEDKIIELDYEHNEMIIHTKLPALSTDFQQLKLTLDERETLFIEGISTIEKDTFGQKFMIHSGYSGTILYNDAFANEQGLDSVLVTIKEQELKDAFGNIIKTKKAMLPHFKLGETAFENLPVGFFVGPAGRQPINVMGADLLKRFNVIFDLANGHIYLKKNGLMEGNYFGMG